MIVNPIKIEYNGFWTMLDDCSTNICKLEQTVALIALASNYIFSHYSTNPTKSGRYGIW